MITPAAHLDRLDEVLVVTSTQPRFSPQEQQDLATSEEIKGAEAAQIKEQKKASEIMAERLPGLIDPNLPPDQQPLHDNSNPNPVAHPPQALHPDRFSPGNAPGSAPDATQDAAPDAHPASDDANAQPESEKPAAKPAQKPTPPAKTKPQSKPKSTPPPASPPGGNR
jgi:rod shape-determining protein MreC